MKYLFVHQNFLGQYMHIVRHLAKSPDNDIVFISQGTNQKVQNVRSVFYNGPKASSKITPALLELDLAYKRGIEVYKTAKTLKNLGYEPDIIIGHQGWGELLNIHDVYPKVPLLKYCEFYYNPVGLDVDFDPEFPSDEFLPSRVRFKNTVNLISATSAGWGQTPTNFQYSTYPAWARETITVLREGVDLETCKPEPEVKTKIFKVGDFIVNPGDKLVTYVARGLEPYRGFHIFMRSLPQLLTARSDIKIVIVGRDQVSYGATLEGGLSWREFMLKEVHNRLDESRVCFSGQVSYEMFCQILKRSDAHIYMTYPFVLSWSLREAMAMGCSIIASDTQPVREFIKDRETGLLTPFHDPSRLSETVLEVLENTALSNDLSEKARKEAEDHLSMKGYLNSYEALIDDLINGRTPPNHLGTSPNSE